MVLVENTRFQMGMALLKSVESGMQAHGRFLSDYCRLHRRHQHDTCRIDHGG